MSVYLVDSNFFIQAHRAYYPLDVVTSFWSKVAELSNRGNIKSIDKVKIEIYDNSTHEDELKQWCVKNLPFGFFIETGYVVSNYAEIAKWANSMAYHFRKNAIDEFLATNKADPWLVATAMEEGYTLVTYEKSEPNRRSRIKIPEVCNYFGVRYIDTVQMLREMKEII